MSCSAARASRFSSTVAFGRCPEHGTWPRNNAEFWRDKIQANVRRDRDTDLQMSHAGWTVIRVWEHDDPKAAAAQITAVVRERRG